MAKRYTAVHCALHAACSGGGLYSLGSSCLCSGARRCQLLMCHTLPTTYSPSSPCYLPFPLAGTKCGTSWPSSLAGSPSWHHTCTAWRPSTHRCGAEAATTYFIALAWRPSTRRCGAEAATACCITLAGRSSTQACSTEAASPYNTVCCQLLCALCLLRMPACCNHMPAHYCQPNSCTVSPHMPLDSVLLLLTPCFNEPKLGMVCIKTAGATVQAHGEYVRGCVIRKSIPGEGGSRARDETAEETGVEMNRGQDVG